MLDNFFLLNETAKFLRKEISGYKIKEVFTQEKDKVVISLLSIETLITKFLEFSTSDKLPYILIKEDFKKAKKNVLNFLTGLYEQDIVEVGILDNDRIIMFTLSGELKILFVFFKSKYNLLVTYNGKIIDSFKDKKELSGLNLEEYFKKKISYDKGSLGNVKDYFREYYRNYGDTVFKEILFRLQVKSGDLINEELKLSVSNIIEEIKKSLLNPKYIIYKSKNAYIPSLFTLKHLEESEKSEFDDINKLIFNYIKSYYIKTSDEGIKKDIIAKKENLLKNQEKKLESFRKQLEISENYDILKRYGELILSNIHILKSGDEKLEIDEESNNEKIVIKLKKELSPAENATIYFDKYKKQKKSIDVLNERINSQKSILEELKKEIEDIKNNTNLNSLKMLEKEVKKDDETSKFRKFILDEKYEVWVGKDSASNDLLTTRYSSQSDLWFHVRGASGSHTVLKISDRKNQPEKRIIEKAASIAAYYSKARNASNVPVAYCEKKYVKKKKGFKEGSVVMEREKVIFVKPGLPENIS